MAYVVLVPSATTDPNAIVFDPDLERPLYDHSHLDRVYRGGLDGDGRRSPPPKVVRTLLLADFSGRCAYCRGHFGQPFHGPRTDGVLRLEWDHFVPYDYLRSSPARNWLPACHVCNRLKRNRMFETLAEARARLEQIRSEHGYRINPEVFP